MYSLEHEELRKLELGFGQRGSLSPVTHVSEAERPGNVSGHGGGGCIK